MTLREQVSKSLKLDTADDIWLLMLDQADEVIQTIAALKDQVESEGLTVRGGNNQVVIHPALVEIRAQRLVLAKITRELGLGDQPAQAGTLKAHQSKAADARWGRR